MSISAVSAAFKASQEVNGARRWTLLILCEYADDEGYSYPKVSTICRRAAISRDETVREALRWLEAEGYIERIINGWAGVKGDIPEGKRPNLYRIHLSSIGAPTGPKTVREPGAGATQKSGRSPTQKTGRSDYPENGEQNRHSEPPHEPTTPTPPEEGKSSTLFDPPPELRSEKV